MRSATSWITPSREELKRLIQKSGLPVQKFFNTSGKKYRELNLKEKLKTMSEEEMLDLLSSDGMLIKRPIVTDGERVTVGFRRISSRRSGCGGMRDSPARVWCHFRSKAVNPCG